jgi:hypothetical protein
MTGQDAVVDAPAIEREARARTPIVERKDAPAVVDHQDRTVAAMNNEPSFRPEFCKAPCEREFRRRRIHGRSPVSGPQVLVIVVFWTGLAPRFSRGFTPNERAENAAIPRRRCSGRASPGPIGERYRRGAPVQSCDFRLA